ncbi:FAD-binding oxidoreductase [Acidisoma cellulosilytica]|uniref:FAD-binding oxidoreductase n=1 Tax=Acidisoma cellulosilyticum TaxID=2802395 RepID=A0A963Z872_9PROT|nr:FAD-binding oxidoreductase [Acidisoma cellulosilyticum]MCB8883850.1 FAD-binding oxidoreductase [Acidisoma cellulosilyticum]
MANHDPEAPDSAKLKADFGFKGAVLTPSDPGFDDAVFGGLWNKLRPARHPAIIAQVEDEDDVAAAVTFARAVKLKVTVRGGGHSWCGTSLRRGSLLIDLTKLNKIISVDPLALTAVVQPIVTNREVQSALNREGLAFPTGHCPSVKVSGYFLSGGMSWNHGVWGPGVGSVKAIELITAAGDRITASATENQDYFWAARGAGAGFFGVVLRYHLTLYPLPKAITSSVYYYPYEQVEALAGWLDGLVRKLPPSVELSLFVVHAPADLAESAVSSNGKLALVTATMFADVAEEAVQTLRLFDSFPSIDQCLQKFVAQPTTFEALFDASGALWPSDLRSLVDAQFYRAPLVEAVRAVKDHLITTPSAKTVFLFSVYTGPDAAPPTPKDAAFSATGPMYGGPWTMWDSADQDAENLAWHEECVALLQPSVVAHYVGETNIVGHPDYAEQSFGPGVWQRLQDLRQMHDPDGLFFGFTEGLT